MSAVGLTPEQAAAVTGRDEPRFVRAGAGSGKTRVLVERFLASVREDGVGVDRILAITFTEKAAAELRSRVRERLLAAGDREAARQAESAAISTIHGFCSRLLRAHALDAGLDPDFRVLDEVESARLALDAFDAALEAFLESAVGGGERLDLAAAYSPDRLRTMVTAVHGRLRSRGEREPRLPRLKPPRASGERDRLEAAVARASAELGSHEGNGKSVDAARAVLDRCGRYFGRLPDGSLADPEDLEKLVVKGGNTKVLNTEAFAELKEAHEAYATFCAASRAAGHHALLAELLKLYDVRYAALKDARSALDFEDLELLARDLLAGDRELCESVRARYAQVMVDEFQDTNRLQNEIVDLVAGGRLFAVGDERQSIYGFRHADVELFRERGAAAAEAGRASSLRTNFRSRPELIAAVNAAFASVWDEFEPLAAAPGADGVPPRVDPCVELLLVDRSKPRWEAAVAAGAFGTGVGEAIWRGAEARLLARRIEELAGPGGPFEYGDVAILLRASTDMALYERALVERGIPAYSHGGRGFSEAQQVGDLRAYMAALANPLDELSMTMLLASPLAGVSLGSVASISRRASRLGRDPWWALQQAFGPDGDGSDGLAAALPERDRARVAAFVERFARERAEAPRLALETVIDRAVTDSGYDRVVLAMPGGERRLANVRKLMRIARRFEATEGRDLRRFIDHLDEREELRAHEGEAPVEGDARTSAVRLMTIHSAKGLEFPVVCVADLGRPMRGGDDGGLQVAEDGRVGLRYASLSGERRGALDWERLEEEQTARAEEEERRIFYVAMTRAQEHLVLSGATDLVKWPEPRPLREPIDWIWPAVAPGAKDLLAGPPPDPGSGGAKDPGSAPYLGVDDRETEHGRVRVRCVKLAPDVADDVLPPEDRAPAAQGAGEGEAAAAAGASGEAPSGEPASGEAAAAGEPAPPGFAAATPARPLPVARLSYSALESYRRCGYRFYLERVARLSALDRATAAGRSRAAETAARTAENGQLVLALETPPPAPPPSDGITPLLRGTIVHQLLERLDMRDPRTPDAEAIEQVLRGHGAPAAPDEVERVAGLIEGFVRSPLSARIAAAEHVRTELAFSFELPAGDRPPVLVNGVVDVHAEERDGLLIVDYKTDPLHGEDPAALVERDYTTQRLVYALAGLRSGAERVEVAYSLLEAADEPVAMTFGPADRERLEAGLADLAAGVLGGRFEPTAVPHRELCWTCPGRPALCSWGQDMTLRDLPARNAAVRPTADVR